MFLGHHESCTFLLSGIREDCRCRNRTDIQLIAITFAIFTEEFLGGTWTGSIALVADSFHVLSDNVVLLAVIAASWMSARAVEEKRVAVSNAWTVVISLMLLFTAWEIFHAGIARMEEPRAVVSGWMIVIATLGAIGNAVQHRIASRGHGHARHNHHDMLILHIVTDGLQSIAVIIGAGVMWATGMYVIDAWLSIGIAALLAGGTLWQGAKKMIRDGGNKDCSHHRN